MSAPEGTTTRAPLARRVARRVARAATGARTRRLAAVVVVAGLGPAIGWALAPGATTEVAPMPSASVPACSVTTPPR